MARELAMALWSSVVFAGKTGAHAQALVFFLLGIFNLPMNLALFTGITVLASMAKRQLEHHERKSMLQLISERPGVHRHLMCFRIIYCNRNRACSTCLWEDRSGMV